ncbi:putative kinetochore protein NUF2 [Nannochloris sp. 'desiccata']|nr:hypothetical protein KSW81_000378 [Chlorella desiccata (nom. nud.)]KAH7620988.1 putative kinetochore protein NUF2 [Chlorella desiccata (nom. nud.)]
MSHYSFPILTDREVAQCLNELGMTYSVEQLSKPTFELVHPIYENLVTALVGITREEMQQPVFSAIDALEFPELHDESIPVLAFHKALSKLLTASGVKDFSFRDLYKPEPQRLRRNLSAIINFAKFREEKLTAYTELQESFETLLTTKETLESEHAALQAELAALKESQAAELPEAARIEAEAQTIYAENQTLNRKQAALAGEVRSLKQQGNTLTDEASQLRYKLSQARGTGEDLRAQIVQSPQKIQALLEEIATAVERERIALVDADRRSRDLASRLEVVSKVERDVVKAVGMMEDAELEIGRKKEISKKVKSLRAQVAASEHEAIQLATQHQHLKRQQAALVERIERVRTQCEVKRQAAEGRVEEQLRSKEAITAENAAALAKLAENEAMIRALRDRIAEMRGAHEASVNYVLGQYHGLREAVSMYHDDMENAVAEAPAPPAVTPATATRPINVR